MVCWLFLLSISCPSLLLVVKGVVGTGSGMLYNGALDVVNNVGASAVPSSAVSDTNNNNIMIIIVFRPKVKNRISPPHTESNLTQDIPDNF